MLAVFAPQILLYGLAVVLYGILQAHRRFTAPALAPILSSIVVIGAYCALRSAGPRAHHEPWPGSRWPRELTLSVGTTLGVAALCMTAIVPAWRLRLRLRPALRFPEGIAKTSLEPGGGRDRRARRPGRVGARGDLAGQRARREQGGTYLYSYGWQVFVSVYAVLAIPIAISAFPVLAARQRSAVR